MTREPDDLEWASRHLVLEVPHPARRLATGQDVNVGAWLRNVGDAPVEIMTSRSLSAIISSGPDVVAGPSGMRASARILNIAPGEASEYGLWLNTFTTMNSPSSAQRLPPGEYTYTGTLSYQFFYDRRSEGGIPDGPRIKLPTGPWPLTIIDAESS